ncbi:MAG: riboflavin biosynthesis protein RibF [Asticcacaulis sp.]
MATPYPSSLKAFLLTLEPGGNLRSSALSEAAVSQALPKGASAAIGSFDGVHQGHQRVIENAVATGRMHNAPSAVIAFDPHPQTYFLQKAGKEVAPFRLMTLPQQFKAFEALGVSTVFVLRFDPVLAGLAPEDFVRTLLHEHLQLVHVACGFDFRFGHKGAGDAQLLSRLGAELGFTTSETACQTDETGHKLSSSAVREALQSGNVQLAGHILGRPQAYRGTVTRGDQIGRTIGFPTANIDMGDYLRPKQGVYITRTHLDDGRTFGSVTNFGKRPTVNGLSERFETHIFDLDHEIYDRVIEVELLHYLRPEQKFDSFDALKAQIARDAETARDYFAG